MMNNLEKRVEAIERQLGITCQHEQYSLWVVRVEYPESEEFYYRLVWFCDNCEKHAGAWFKKDYRYAVEHLDKHQFDVPKGYSLTKIAKVDLTKLNHKHSEIDRPDLLPCTCGNKRVKQYGNRYGDIYYVCPTCGRETGWDNKRICKISKNSVFYKPWHFLGWVNCCKVEPRKQNDMLDLMDSMKAGKMDLHKQLIEYLAKEELKPKPITMTLEFVPEPKRGGYACEGCVFFTGDVCAMENPDEICDAGENGYWRVKK